MEVKQNVIKYFLIIGYFGKRCIEATETYLINLGCSSLLSRNACSSVKGHDCFWNGNECKEITD
jgi:hypothetical protein